MGRQAGYTIIEVTLFLAVTGLLILGVGIGFSSTINNNQRADSTRAFEAAIEAAYSGVRSGEISRRVDGAGKATCKIQAAYPGASNECVVIGKVLYFKDTSTINVYNVVSSITPDPLCTDTGLESLMCYHPTILDVDDVAGVISPTWQATANQVVFQDTSDNSYDPLNMVAFLRHPLSELVYIAPFNEPGLPVSGSYELTGLANKYANSKGQVCLVHTGATAFRTYVRFNGGEGVGGIDTSTDPLTGAPAC